jgi:hypothetical protein
LLWLKLTREKRAKADLSEIEGETEIESGIETSLRKRKAVAVANLGGRLPSSLSLQLSSLVDAMIPRTVVGRTQPDLQDPVEAVIAVTSGETRTALRRGDVVAAAAEEIEIAKIVAPLALAIAIQQMTLRYTVTGAVVVVTHTIAPLTVLLLLLPLLLRGVLS